MSGRERSSRGRRERCTLRIHITYGCPGGFPTPSRFLTTKCGEEEGRGGYVWRSPASLLRWKWQGLALAACLECDSLTHRPDCRGVKLTPITPSRRWVLIAAHANRPIIKLRSRRLACVPCIISFTVPSLPCYLTSEPIQIFRHNMHAVIAT